MAEEIAERELRDDRQRYSAARFFAQWRQGDFAGARTAADSVLAGSGREQASVILYYLARSQMDGGHYDQAMLSLQRLQQNLHYAGPRPFYYAPSYYLMGRAFEEKGNHPEAIRHYEKFVEMWRNADDDLVLLDAAHARLKSLQVMTPQ